MKTIRCNAIGTEKFRRTGCGWRSILWVLLHLLGGFATVLPVSGQTGGVQVPFTLRHHSDEAVNGIYTLKGDFIMTANTNLLGVSSGDNGAQSNFDFTFVDIDNDTNTFNSSRAELKLPARVTSLPVCPGHDWSVVYAGLYWTGKGNMKVVKYHPSTNVRQHIFAKLPLGYKYWYRTTKPADTTNYRLFYKTTTFTPANEFGWVYLVVPNGNPLISLTAPVSGLSSITNQDCGTMYYKSNEPVWNQNGQNWTPEEKGTVLIKKEGVMSYDTVRATSADNRWVYGVENKHKYVCYQDVTTYVQEHGMGNYIVANIKTQEGSSDSDIGNFGGWGLIVVYQHPDEKMRNIAIFDGFADLADNGTSAFSFGLQGFKSVLSGPVNVKLGMMSGEGDEAISHDWLNILKSNSLTTNPLSDWLTNPCQTSNNPAWYYIPNPDDAGTNSWLNYFRSTISTGGNDRFPNVVNNCGIDAHTFMLNNTDKSLIGNGQTETAFSYRGNTDELVMFMVALSVDAYTPEPIAYIKDVVPGGGTPVNPGDTISYRIELSNRGTESIDSLVVKLPLPYNATYIPGSLQITNHLPSGICYDNQLSAYYQNDSLNHIVIHLKHLPGPNDTTGVCLVSKPWNPDSVWASISFRLRATDQCVYLDNECAHSINLLGKVSGKGTITGTRFNNTSVYGWTEAVGECQRIPQYGPNVVGIKDSVCQGDDKVTREFCVGEVYISLSEIKQLLPRGVYDFYKANDDWSRKDTIQLASFPGSGNYLAYPVNNFNPECNSPIKILIIVPEYKYLDTIYVKTGACSNGRSWAHPMGSLQLAMKYARKAVWVAAGTYNSGTYGNNGYTLKDSIKIYGGFRADPTDAVDNDIKFRHPLNNPTVLIQPAGATVPVVASPATLNVGTLLNGFFIQGSTRGAAALKDKITLEYCVIRNNSTGSNPVVLFDSGGKLVNSLITANSSSGGILHFANGGALHFSTLTKNSGTAILASGTTAGSVTNSIVWGNTTQTSGSPATAISYSGVQGLNGTTYGTTTNNNIALDPINLNTWGPNFGNAPDDSTEIYNGFRLNLFSRLKGAADNGAVASLALTADLSRVHRIKGANADMGAFESRYLLTPAGNLAWSGNTTHTFWPATATQGNPETSDFVLLHQGTHARLDGHTTLDAVVFNEGPDSLINAGSSSGNNCGVASLFTSDKTLTVGDVYYARRFKPGKWHFLYLPYRVNKAGGVLDSLLQPLSFGTDYSVKWYNGIKRSVYGSNDAGTAGKNWEYVTSDTLSKNRGYNFAVLSEKLVYFKANASGGNKEFLGQSNYPLQLTFEPLGNLGAYDGDQGWNLFGIPYSSFYQPNGNISLPANWYETKGAMFNVVFWNSDLSGGDKYVPVVTTLENKLFPPFTALFTEIPGTPNPSDYTLAANGRQYQNVSYLYNPTNLYQARSASTEKPLLIALNLQRAEVSDRALIVLNPLASAGFEVGRDMGKFGNSSSALPQLYTLADGKRLGINEIPPANGNTAVPLHLYIGTAGQHRIRPESNPLIEQYGYSLFLEDTELNQIAQLTDGGYIFNASTGTLDNRFVLHIARTITALPTTDGLIWMTAGNNKLTVNGLHPADRIEVSDIGGRILIQTTATANSLTATLPYPGIFFVKVYHTTGTVTQKIINK